MPTTNMEVRRLIKDTAQGPQPQAPNRDFFTIPETARMLGLNPNTVWRWVWAGIIPTVKIESTRRIRRKDFDRFIEERMERGNRAS